MNILKLAKNLEKFSLDEIELLAEQDCSAELENLVVQNILTFDGAVYKFCGKEKPTFYSNKKYEIKLDMQTSFAKAAHGYILSRDLSRAGLKKYHYQLKTHLCPYFGDTPLDKITAKMLRDFINRPRDRYCELTRIMGIVFTGSILKWAFKEGLIKENPYLKVKHIVAEMKRQQARKERYHE